MPVFLPGLCGALHDPALAYRQRLYVGMPKFGIGVEGHCSGFLIMLNVFVKSSIPSFFKSLYS